MSAKHLLMSPHGIKGQHCLNREDVWWYEENGGIVVYYNHGNDSLKIAWTSLRNALARKDTSDFEVTNNDNN